MRYATTSPKDTAEFGRALAAWLRPGDAVLLRGEMGAGKSVLARGIAAGLGVDEAMPSPTFTLMQPYQGRVAVYHFDLYRLDGPDELYAAGLDEYIGGDGVAIIEWPDNCDIDASPRLDIWLAGYGEGRVIDIEAHDMGAAAPSALNKWREARA